MTTGAPSRQALIAEALYAERARTARLERTIHALAGDLAAVDAVLDDVATAISQWISDGGTLHVTCLADLADELRDARRIIERANLQAVQA